MHKSKNYSKNVLERIVAIVKFLTSKGLKFSDDNEIFQYQQKSTCLECLELISEFGRFLSEPMQIRETVEKDIDNICLQIFVNNSLIQWAARIKN